jgi:hypothetical protein
MKKLIPIIAILLLFQACDSTSAIQDPPPKPVQELKVNYNIKTFGKAKHMEAFVNDSLIDDTTTRGEWVGDTILDVGDTLRTQYTILEVNYGGTTMGFSTGDKDINPKCHVAAGYPIGYIIDCDYILTQQKYDFANQ